MNPPSQHADPQARREQIARGLARANFAAVIIVGVVIGLALIALAAAWRADLSARDARSATQRAGEELWQARFAQAKAERLGGGVGRRDAGLTALATAARIRLTRELRDEAIGLLALTDLEEAPRFWPYQPNLNEGTLAFDRSGHRFGWGDQQGNAWVRNIDDGQIVAQLSRRGAEVTGCTFSPDDRELAVHYNDGLVRIWNWEAKTVRVEWQGGRGLGWREGLSYSANGEYLAVHDLAAKRMRVFATTNGKEVSARMDDGDSMVFSPVDPEVLLIGSGEGVRFLRWRTGDVTRRLAVPDGNGTIRASEDGRWLAAGASTGVITLWDLQAGTTNTLVAHKDFVSDLIFGARQGLLISRSWDGTTRLWELASARSILTTRRGYAMSLSQDGERLIYMREKAGIGFWRLQRPASFRVVGSSPAENVAISSPWFSPDGRWLVASQESGLMLWDVSGRHSPIALNFENMIYGAAQFVDEGRELWAAAANGIRRWRIQWPPPDAINANAPPVVTGGEIIPGTEADEIEGLLAPAKDQIVFCRNRMEVIWLDTRSGKVIRKFGPHPGVLSVSVSPDLHWLATSGRHGARMNLWDMQTGQFVREMDARDAVVSFSPDGRWLACSLGYEITLRDTRDWQARPAFPREVTSGLPGLVAFSPDSRWLAIPQSEQELQLVDVEANAIRASFPSPNPVNFRGCTFSPDSRSIVVTAGNEVQMWNLAVLEKELDSLGMGWRQPASPTTTRTEASRTDFITTETGAMFAIIAGGNVLAAIALTFAVYRRHRQWLRDYAEVEALAAGRDRELKAAQQEILVSQKMQALGTLAAGVAHDFNN
ncbi:MAG TPA: hypothetical protein VHH73_02345, partial [Verrucomicrobiae bacterium]|nr:hypothetical protein [Verrucomicrobiae bacterium]